MTPKALTVLRAPSEATVVMVPTVWGGGQEHARRGGGRWAHTARDAPPSFLVLVKLQVTGEGNQEGLNEGLIPLSGPIAPVPLTLGSPWELLYGPRGLDHKTRRGASRPVGTGRQ